MELKYNQSAKGAIAQIMDRQYTEKLAAYEENMLFVGVNYDKDSVEKKHTCVIEVW